MGDWGWGIGVWGLGIGPNPQLFGKLDFNFILNYKIILFI